MKFKKLLILIPITLGLGALATPFIINSCSCKPKKLTVLEQLDKICKENAVKFVGDSAETYNWSEKLHTDNDTRNEICDFLDEESIDSKINIFFNGFVWLTYATLLSTPHNIISYSINENLIEINTTFLSQDEAKFYILKDHLNNRLQFENSVGNSNSNAALKIGSDSFTYAYSWIDIEYQIDSYKPNSVADKVQVTPLRWISYNFTPSSSFSLFFLQYDWTNAIFPEGSL